MCPLDLSITEDNSGVVGGSAILQVPCGGVAVTVAGSNNTGNAPDRVVLTFNDILGFAFIFNGNFDGDDALSGLVNGRGCTDCPTSFTRNSIAPFQIPAAARRKGGAPIKDPFLLGN